MPGLLPFRVQTFRRFKGFKMGRVCKHCGWRIQGFFDLVGPLSSEKRTPPDLNVGECNYDILDFMEVTAEA
jgi:hypothetical protein